MIPITNGRHVFGATLTERAKAFTADLKRRYGVDLPGMGSLSTATPLATRVNHSRWIVDCPTCNSAEYLWPGEPLFMCTNCWNATVDNKWRVITMPAQRLAIERILEVRPAPQNRNWEPWESLDDLRRQNRENGLPEEVD